ncbi:CHASE domain-containing protein [uncultured Thiodictyon sp.]|uniref:sensor domain-containing diguanylate cyclase n=1 Tax=uncultured Thiodictyon sp. TaxID=1846217 RepID=UPI0025D76383|nr:CHASE domain-containing protein [uncultured Thiodictyon sp.]
MPRARLPELLVLTLGLLISLALAWAVWQWETEERAERLRDDVAVYTQAIAQQLQSLVMAVQAVAQLYGASEVVRADEFELFTRPFLERNPAIRALEWLPLVLAAQRADFEAQARAQGLADFAIREQSGTDLLPAGARPAYFPVWRVEPLTGNARALGFDAGSERHRRAALEGARDRGQAVATIPVSLVQETANQRAIVIFVPCAQGATPQERRQRLQGYAAGITRLGDLVNGVVAALPPRGLDLVLADAGLPGAAGLLHVHSSRSRGPGTAPDAAALGYDTAGYETRLAVADRTLVLRAFPVGAAYRPSYAWSLALGGAGGVTSLALSALLWSRRRAATRLREREELFGLFMDHSPTVAWIKDAQGRWVYASKTFERCFGVSLQDLRVKTDHAVWPPELAARFAADDQRVLAADHPLEIDESAPSADGQVRHWQTIKFPFRGADGRRFVAGIGIDVTEHKQAQLQLEAALCEAQLARVDALTGIANRAGFEDRLAQAFAQARRHGRRFALISLDLDGFKAINDTHGHQVGDRVLTDIASTLSQHCRLEDVAGRCGGDEFALVLSELADPVIALAVAERVRDAIANLDWNGGAVSASLGIALYPDHAEEIPELIRLADLAMYASKAAGKNRVTLASPRAPEAAVSDAPGSAA